MCGDRSGGPAVPGCRPERSAELAKPAIARASSAAALMSQLPMGAPGPSQVGAFVPAAFASLTPCDRLLARLGTGDSLETCSSSFMVEMQARRGAEAWGVGARPLVHWLSATRASPPDPLQPRASPLPRHAPLPCHAGGGPHPVRRHAPLPGPAGRAGARHQHRRRRGAGLGHQRAGGGGGSSSCRGRVGRSCGGPALLLLPPLPLP